jgi:hypothetical protein
VVVVYAQKFASKRKTKQGPKAWSLATRLLSSALPALAAKTTKMQHDHTPSEIGVHHSPKPCSASSAATHLCGTGGCRVCRSKGMAVIPCRKMNYPDWVGQNANSSPTVKSRARGQRQNTMRCEPPISLQGLEARKHARIFDHVKWKGHITSTAGIKRYANAPSTRFDLFTFSTASVSFANMPRGFCVGAYVCTALDVCAYVCVCLRARAAESIATQQRLACIEWFRPNTIHTHASTAKNKIWGRGRTCERAEVVD